MEMTQECRKQDRDVLRRVEQAENGEWIELLRQYVDEIEAERQHDINVGQRLSAWRPAPEKQYRLVGTRTAQGGTRQARAAVEAGPQVADDESTLRHFEGLLPVQVDDGERHKLKKGH